MLWYVFLKLRVITVVHQNVTVVFSVRVIFVEVLCVCLSFPSFLVYDAPNSDFFPSPCPSSFPIRVDSSCRSHFLTAPVDNSLFYHPSTCAIKTPLVPHLPNGDPSTVSLSHPFIPPSPLPVPSFPSLGTDLLTLRNTKPEYWGNIYFPFVFSLRL